MEANFVGDVVADNLKCIVCHLVLKDPVLIIDCGHRLCKLCFESVRDYATKHDNLLQCPHDRQNVNIDKVVDDIGVGRMVMDLQVFCDNKSEGCNWSGELRHLRGHVDKQCNVTSLKKFMETVEMRLNKKDAEIQELQARLSLRDEEVQGLRTQLFSLAERREVENLRTESRKKSNEMEERLRIVEKNILEKEEDLALVRYEISGLRVSLAREAKGAESSSSPEPKKRKTRRSMADDEKENQQTLVVQLNDSGTGGGESVESIKQECKEMDRKIALLNFKLASVCKELSCAQLKGVEYLTEKVNGGTDDMCSKKDLSNQGASSSSVKSVTDRSCGSDCEHCAEIRSLKERVMNVQTYIPNEHIVFVWKIRNYAYYEELGKRLDSPQFYSDFCGHCCNLNLTWDTDKNLGVFINTHVGLGVPDEPLTKQVQFSSMDKNGKEMVRTFLASAVADSFIIKAGQQCSTGRGYQLFLRKSSVQDFVIDDVLTIKCKLTNDKK